MIRYIEIILGCISYALFGIAVLSVSYIISADQFSWQVLAAIVIFVIAWQILPELWVPYDKRRIGSPELWKSSASPNVFAMGLPAVFFYYLPQRREVLKRLSLQKKRDRNVLI